MSRWSGFTSLALALIAVGAASTTSQGFADGEPRDGLSTSVPLEQQSPRIAVITSDASDFSCRLQKNGAEIQHLSGSRLELQCPASDERISCGGTGVEPRDLTIAKACMSGQIHIASAKTVRVVAPTKAPLKVEWLDIAPGGEVSTLAIRETTPGADLTMELALAPSSTRYLRFHRFAASPVTVSSEELIKESGRFSLPRSSGGGEIVVFPSPSSVRPESVQIIGPVSRVQPFNDGTNVRAAGLLEGTYRLQPLYAGGIRGRTVPVAIANLKSIVVVLPTEDVGAVEVVGVRQECELGGTISLFRLGPGQRSSVNLVTSHRELAACRWTFSGLSPGKYAAALGSVVGASGLATFNVEGGRVLKVTLERPQVVVSGSVTHNGAPLPNASVVALDAAGPGLRRAAKTGPDGSYRLRLDKPGTHIVRVEGEIGRRMPISKTTVLNSGSNTLDLSFSSGTVDVHLVNSDPKLSTRVVFQRVGATLNMLLPPGTAIARRDGLEHGEYRVFAEQGDAGSRVSLSQVVVSVSESTPNQTIKIPMGAHLSVLSLFDSNGKPIIGAKVEAIDGISRGQISAGGGQSPRARFISEVSPGVFDLQSVPVGFSLIVRPPGNAVPTCRKVVAGRQDTFTTPEGRPVFMVIAVPGLRELSPIHGDIVGMPGSECPVPLSAFTSTTVAGEAAGFSGFSISAFPKGDSMKWRLLVNGQEWLQPIATAGPGPIVLTPPGR